MSYSHLHAYGWCAHWSSDVMTAYLVAAKWITQSIHLFLNLLRVIYAGLLDGDEEDIAESKEYITLSFCILHTHLTSLMVGPRKRN